MKRYIKNVTLMKLYTIWVSILVVFTAISMLTGRYQELMAEAVEKVIHTSTSGISFECNLFYMMAKAPENKKFGRESLSKYPGYAKTFMANTNVYQLSTRRI